MTKGGKKQTIELSVGITSNVAGSPDYYVLIDSELCGSSIVHSWATRGYALDNLMNPLYVHTVVLCINCDQF